MTPQTRSLQGQTETINESERTVRLSFASQEPYNRYYGPEILQCTSDSIDLQRFSDGLGCLLYNHNRDEVIGHIESTEIIDGRAYATVKFDTDEQSDLIYQKVKAGTLQGVSVGYTVSNWEFVKDGEKSQYIDGLTGPAYVAIKWEPLEISIVAVPADATVGIGRAVEDNDSAAFLVSELQEEPAMEETKITADVHEKVRNADVTPPAAPAVDTDAIRAQAQEAERERASQVMDLCRQFDVDSAEFIRSGASIEDVRAGILSQLAAERQAVGQSIDVGVTETEKIREAASDAILMRGGIAVAKPAEGAENYRSMRLRDLMIDAVEREGTMRNARYADDNDLIRAAMSGTGAFPNILAAAVNKSAATAYQAVPTTFERWTSVGSNSDFKPTRQVRISEAGELIEIKEGGEFKFDELTDAMSEKTIATYGRSFGLTRNAIINDDLGMLTRVPRSYAMAARRGLNKLVYQTLANVKFDAAKYGNKAATGGALSVDTLSAARLAMRTQKNIGNKEIIGITPQYLIIPAALETSTYQLLHSISDPSQANPNVVNPFSGSGLQVIVDAELDAISSSGWYLAALPGAGVDTIEVTYLNGNQNPIIESRTSWETLGVEYRIYIDYGVNILDNKGLYFNAGK